MIKNAWISKSYKNIFLKKIIKNFPLITQFFYVPFGVFRREIAGNGHSRLLKFKTCPLECVCLRAGLVKFRWLRHWVHLYTHVPR